MVQYNYHWSAKKQQRKIREDLFSYLRNVIAKYSPFYREWFANNNIDAKSIYTYEDFQKIPPITKAEHMSNPSSFILQPFQPDWWECKYQTSPLPRSKTFRYWLKSLNKTYLRDVFGKEPASEDERIAMEAIKEWLPIQFLNTGHSDDTALIAYTQHDILKNIPEIVSHLYITGFRANWEVFNVMPATPSIFFFQSVWSPLSVGGGTFFTCDVDYTPIERQLKIASNITFEVFYGTPSFTLTWLKAANDKLNKNELERISSFKMCILTGESISLEEKEEIKTLFEKLGSTPKIIESYSNNRVKASFFECSEGSGIHLNPRYFYWEVLDPKTYQPVEEGEKGLLCVSHVNWRGTAFIRLITGDIVDGLQWEQCTYCGLTFPKIIGKIKRN